MKRDAELFANTMGLICSFEAIVVARATNCNLSATEAKRSDKKCGWDENLEVETSGRSSSCKEALILEEALQFSVEGDSALSLLPLLLLSLS